MPTITVTHSTFRRFQLPSGTFSHSFTQTGVQIIKFYWNFNEKELKWCQMFVISFHLLLTYVKHSLSSMARWIKFNGSLQAGKSCGIFQFHFLKLLHLIFFTLSSLTNNATLWSALCLDCIMCCCFAAFPIVTSTIYIIFNNLCSNLLSF